MPDNIPENSDVWEKYSEEPNYKSMYGDYKMYSDHLKKTYTEYLEHLKQLQEVRDLVQDRKNDLREAKMFKKFSVICESEMKQKMANEVILNEAQEICETQLKIQEVEMQKQQEEVLKLQSLLKFFLMKRRDIKKQLNDDFQKFCIDNYNMPMVPTDVFHEEDDFMLLEIDNEDTLSPVVQDEMGTRKLPAGSDLKRMKKMMIRERHKTIANKQSKITWK